MEVAESYAAEPLANSLASSRPPHALHGSPTPRQDPSTARLRRFALDKSWIIALCFTTLAQAQFSPVSARRALTQDDSATLRALEAEDPGLRGRLSSFVEESLPAIARDPARAFAALGRRWLERRAYLRGADP